MSVQAIQVLMPRGDGSYKCGLGVPTHPTQNAGALAGMSHLIYLNESHMQDLMAAFNPTPGVNAVQTVTISANTTGGTFTLTDWKQETTTPALAWNASAATVQTELCALPAIGTGNAQVTLVAGVYTITFQGNMGQQAVPLLTATGTLVPGAATVTVANQITGSPSPAPIQIVSQVDGMGELSVSITDNTSSTWTYRVVPAIEMGSTKFAFLGRLISGRANAIQPQEGVAEPTEYEWREATVKYQVPKGAPDPTQIQGMQVT